VPWAGIEPVTAAHQSGDRAVAFDHDLAGAGVRPNGPPITSSIGRAGQPYGYVLVVAGRASEWGACAVGAAVAWAGGGSGDGRVGAVDLRASVSWAQRRVDCVDVGGAGKGWGSPVSVARAVAMSWR
jgi:hypothetical protein